MKQSETHLCEFERRCLEVDIPRGIREEKSIVCAPSTGHPFLEPQRAPLVGYLCLHTLMILMLIMCLDASKVIPVCQLVCIPAILFQQMFSIRMDTQTLTNMDHMPLRIQKEVSIVSIFNLKQIRHKRISRMALYEVL